MEIENRPRRNRTNQPWRKSPSRRPLRKPQAQPEVDKSEFYNFFEWDNNPNEVLDDEINFKPLNSGLGFHHRDSHVEKQISFPKTQSLWEKPKYFSFEEAKKKSFSDTALQPFYEPTHEEVFEKIFSAQKDIKKVSRFDVNPLRQLGAWFVDCTAVTAITIMNIVLMSVASDISMFSVKWDMETGLLFSALWGFWYLSYFSVLDYGLQTLGKKLFGLTLMSDNQNAPTLTQTFLRSFFSLFSILTLGLFSYLGGPAAASKTEVFLYDK